MPVLFLWMTIGQFRRELQRYTTTTLAVPSRFSHRTFAPFTAAQFVVSFKIPSSSHLSSVALAWVLLRFMESHMCSIGSSNELISLSYTMGPNSVYGVMVFGSSLRRAFLMTSIHAFRRPTGQGTYVTTTWSNPHQSAHLNEGRAVRNCLRHAL
jgi:hypothetical protein